MAYTQATLSMCERHVAEGERHIADQVARIDRMKTLGHPVKDAEILLRTLQDMQTAHIHHRDRVRADLDASAPPVPSRGR